MRRHQATHAVAVEEQRHAGVAPCGLGQRQLGIADQLRRGVDALPRATRSAIAAQVLGIGQLPWVMADEAVAQGRLEPVLEPWHPPPVAVHAVYPSNRYVTPKLRAFIDLALEKFPRAARAAPLQPTGG
jgi:DNA-binding transcriptional LysR family regulator